MKPDICSENRLIAHLPPEDVARLRPQLVLVPLKFGAVLHESNRPHADVYFPTTATLSIVNHSSDGRTTAVATVGNDGLAGISLFMGGDRSINETVVQGAGYAYRMRASVARSESALGGALQRFAMLYAQALMTEMAQTAACNRLHTTEQQLCRWLLLSTYHSDAGTIAITQRLIANALGTRREAIAEAAAKLRAANLISCGRGSVTIIDRKQLQAHGCECYASAKKEVDRLLAYSIPPKIESLPDFLISNVDSAKGKLAPSALPPRDIQRAPPATRRH
jgi:CRP-like cAMP-binding protein